MKKQLIQEVQRQMLPYLNNAQLKQLQGVLEGVLSGVELSHSAGMVESAKVDTVACFINAKRIEGCSEKTLSYYRQTIVSMLSGIEKEPQEIVTEDLRKYLTVYQMSRKSSKVTIDNIRRILSSYFSWLEDEDYIVKSPVRRIHKVKTAKVIKETYTDEALEIMRDNCCNVRDLAMIDFLRPLECVLVRWLPLTAMTSTSMNGNALFSEKEVRNGSFISMPGQKSISKTIWKAAQTPVQRCLSR